MSEKSTGFAGFLDGFKARNIAVSASSVTYHFDEMRSAVSVIITSQRSKNVSNEILDLLDKLDKTLSNNQQDLLSMAISCGELLKTMLMISKQSGDPSKLLSEDKMKRLIYHYLEFAEITEDKIVGDLAIEIAEIF
jgi:hypothetical protein